MISLLEKNKINQAETILSLIITPILMVGYLTSVHAVTDAELEVLEKQIEQQEEEEKQKVEAETERKEKAKRLAEEQKRKAEENAKRKMQIEKRKQAAKEKMLPPLSLKNLVGCWQGRLIGSSGNRSVYCMNNKSKLVQYVRFTNKNNDSESTDCSQKTGFTILSDEIFRIDNSIASDGKCSNGRGFAMGLDVLMQRISRDELLDSTTSATLQNDLKDPNIKVIYDRIPNDEAEVKTWFSNAPELTEN